MNELQKKAFAHCRSVSWATGIITASENIEDGNFVLSKENARLVFSVLDKVGEMLHEIVNQKVQDD